MEGLIDVHSHSVAGSVLIGVLVLFSGPTLTVPQLSVAFITGRVRVGPFGDDQFGTILERGVWISASVVWFVMHRWILEASSRRSREVVDRLVVRCSVHHSSGAVTTASSVERSI